jgi:hypothetical protein
MYRSAGQWQSAVRVAEAYCPSKAAEVHREMAAAMQQQQGNGGGGGGAAAAAARAQAFERGNDYARAVEAYLSAGAGEGAGAAELDAAQRCWEAGLALAARHQVRLDGCMRVMIEFAVRTRVILAII